MPMSLPEGESLDGEPAGEVLVAVAVDPQLGEDLGQAGLVLGERLGQVFSGPRLCTVRSASREVIRSGDRGCPHVRVCFEVAKQRRGAARRGLSTRAPSLICLSRSINYAIMAAESKARPSPAGRPATTAARARARRSEQYREASDEYAAIRALRQRNWIAAHIRERRYELDLTQHEVAERAGTSHSFISKLERGDHIPTILVLQRVLAVLDEELLIGIERRGDNTETEREIAPVPELASA